MNAYYDEPIFDSTGNYRLIEVSYFRNDLSDLQMYEKVAIAGDVDMRQYSSYSPMRDSSNLLLDILPLNATSAEDSFDILTKCFSPAIQKSVPAKRLTNSMRELKNQKSELFRYLRERPLEDYRSIHQKISLGGESFSLFEAGAIFNPGSLALLSLPAFLAMDWGGVVLQDREGNAGKPLFALTAPPSMQSAFEGNFDFDRIYSFSEYMDMFDEERFRTNNSMTFIYLYGFAQCIAVYSEIAARDFPQANSISDIVFYPPFTIAFDELVKMGAFGRNPFNRYESVWRCNPEGVDNAMDLSEELYATLDVLDRVTPIPMSPMCGAPGLIRSIFYGLIELFELKDYFGIPSWEEIEF